MVFAWSANIPFWITCVVASNCNSWWRLIWPGPTWGRPIPNPCPLAKREEGSLCRGRSWVAERFLRGSYQAQASISHMISLEYRPTSWSCIDAFVSTRKRLPRGFMQGSRTIPRAPERQWLLLWWTWRYEAIDHWSLENMIAFSVLAVLTSSKAISCKSLL